MSTVEVSLEQLTALTYGAIAPDGEVVLHRTSSFKIDAVLLGATTERTTYITRFSTGGSPVSSTVELGSIVRTTYWNSPEPGIGVVLMDLKSRIVVGVGGRRWIVSPGIIPGDSIEVIGDGSPWLDDSWLDDSQRLRDTLQGCISRAIYRDDAPDLVERIKWLAQLFFLHDDLEEDDLWTVQDAPYDPTNAWMLELIHPSEQNLRLLCCPSKETDVLRAPRYARISTVLKTLQRKIGLQLPWTVEELSYAWSELIPESFTRWRFEEVRGDAIVDAYDDDDGPESCMVNQPYTFWYADNEQSVALIKIFDGEKGDRYYGRALLWTDAHGNRYLDRIYPTNNGSHMRALLDYAEEQGWQNIFDVSSPATVTVRMKPSYVGYPYMDSMMYADEYTGVDFISLSNHREGRSFQLQDTDGGLYRLGVGPIEWDSYRERYQDDYETCEECSRVIPGDEAAYAESCGLTLCYRCYQEHLADCQECDEAANPENYDTCEECGGTFHVDDLEMHEESGMTLCEDCWKAWVSEEEETEEETTHASA